MNVLLLEVVALIGATVHTMEPADPTAVAGAEAARLTVAAPMEGATVLMEDGVILAVGKDVAVPEGATKIDLAGLHLIPGLIDATVTFDAEHDILYLSAGVTTVRDTGSPIGPMVQEKTAGMRDRHPGPDLLISSPVFSSPGAATRPDAFLLNGPIEAAQQIAEVVALLDKAGARVDHFAIDSGLFPEQHKVVCAAASTYGVDVWGPVPSQMTVQEAAAQGQTALVGLDSTLDPGQRFESFGSDAEFEAFRTELTGALASGSWSVSPLLMGTARVRRMADMEGDPEALAALGGYYESVWRNDIETFRMLKAGKSLGPLDLSLSRQRALTRGMFKAGVTLVPASGAPSGGIAPGTGLVDELEEWSLAGVSAAEALQLATCRAADALGVRAGRIRSGLPANLVACASDPTRSLEALRNPEVVVIRGRVLERFVLDEEVAALEKRQADLREQRARPLALKRPPMPEGEALLEGTADLVAYGNRSAVERYSVVQLAGGATVYGARIRVLATGKTKARELVLLQKIRAGLVESFQLTLDEVGDDGTIALGENGSHALRVEGVVAAAAKNLSIKRFRAGVESSAQMAEVPIAAIDGSSVLTCLIAAKHFPEGPSYIAGFEGTVMEPLVDRVQMTVSETDGRITMSDTRSARVFGLGLNGELLFAARAQAGGRLEVQPGTLPASQVVTALDVPPKRSFRGDPALWMETAPTVEPKEGTPVEAGGSPKGDGK